MNYRSSINPELGDLFEFWSPAEVQTYVNNVAAGFHALAEDFKKSSVLDTEQTRAWTVLLADFLEFYKGVGFFSRLVLGTVRTAERFATQLKYWRDIFEAKTGKKATGSPVVIPADSQQAGATIKIALIVCGIGAVAWFGIEALRTARVFKGSGKSHG